MRKHVYGYTMVEILMVIVIAAILFGIGIPAFSTMIRGNAMTISIRQLTAKIQAARSYAVTNRCKVAIVFPAEELASVKSSFSYSTYRTCVVTEDSGWKFESWIDGEEWKRLPTGVLIQIVTNGVNVTACKINDIGGTTVSFARCLVFKPDGQMTASSKLGLVYGRFVSGTGIINTEKESGSGNVLYHPVTINQYTGKTTVGEATTTVPAP
ncbi:MAG: putative major pilin subunit [Lentisphaerae bacterium ADurb.Bin242]|nr:MAG: putative major pilin subunit [Lentisphaerae bacterium ADurb.Bin242]